MVEFQRITIVGPGLIGGSFALAMRRAAYRKTITAWGGKRGLALALARGVIDAAEESFDRGVPCDSDLIYLAAPISANLQFIEKFGPQLSRGTIVTDAGSTKDAICSKAAGSLPSGVHFVGGHPVAGKEVGGFENASEYLFDEAPYALTPRTDTDPVALEKVLSLVEMVGAKPLLLAPEEHDRTLALTSHTPQLLASLLAAITSSREDLVNRYRLAGAGFKSMTRLASSPWPIWSDIIETNHAHIREVLTDLSNRLNSLCQALSDPRSESTKRLFEKLFEDAHRGQ